MDGAPLDVEQIQAIAKLPSRQVLYGQLVGMIASPITGLARGLNALLSGVAIALGQVQAKAEAGEIQLGERSRSAEPAPAAEDAAPPRSPPRRPRRPPRRSRRSPSPRARRPLRTRTPRRPSPPLPRRRPPRAPTTRRRNH